MDYLISILTPEGFVVHNHAPRFYAEAQSVAKELSRDFRALVLVAHGFPDQGNYALVCAYDNGVRR